MYTPEFKNILTSTLDGLRAEGLYKEERFIASQQYSQVTLKDGRSVINMCANNYLGLANNPEVMEAAKKAIDQWGFGMASVRFICGTQAHCYPFRGMTARREQPFYTQPLLKG